MDGTGYILIANICVWLAVFGYLLYLQLKFKKVQNIIQGLKKRIDIGTGDVNRSNKTEENRTDYSDK